MELEPTDVEAAVQESKDYRFFLVGRFLTDRLIDFIAMKNTLMSVWEPNKGIAVTNLGEGRYLL